MGPFPCRSDFYVLLSLTRYAGKGQPWFPGRACCLPWLRRHPQVQLIASPSPSSPSRQLASHLLLIGGGNPLVWAMATSWRSWGEAGAQRISSCRPLPPPGLWCRRRDSVATVCESLLSGPHLGRSWAVSGPYLGHIWAVISWAVSGTNLGRIWAVSGRFGQTF